LAFYPFQNRKSKIRTEEVRLRSLLAMQQCAALWILSPPLSGSGGKGIIQSCALALEQSAIRNLKSKI
jgi:hypothetical protein